MYRCTNCGGTMSYPHDSCPHCKVLLNGVRCDACKYVGSKTEFLSNNHLCPKCGTYTYSSSYSGSSSSSSSSRSSSSSFFDKISDANAKLLWKITAVMVILFSIGFIRSCNSDNDYEKPLYTDKAEMRRLLFTLDSTGRLSEYDETLLTSIGKTKDTSFVLPLVHLACHLESSAYLSSVIDVIVTFEDKRAISPLIDLLLVSDQYQRTIIANALSSLGEEIIPEQVKGDINDFDRLAQTKDPRIKKSIIKGLLLYSETSEYNLTRNKALQLLTQMGDPVWKDYLNGSAADFEMICNMTHPEACLPLIEYLNKTRASYSTFDANTSAGKVLTCLLSLNDKRMVSGLLYNYSKFNDQLKQNILTKMLELKAKEAIPIFRNSLKDYESNETNQLAIQGLALLNDKASIAELRQYLFVSELQKITAEALYILGDTAWKGLSSQYTDFEFYGKLGLLKNQDLFKIELHLLEFGHDKFKNNVVVALGTSQDSRAVMPIIRRLTSLKVDNSYYSNNDINFLSAIIALSNLGDKRAIKPIKRLLTENQSIRLGAAEALSKLGETKWTQWIKGDYQDKDRLLQSNDAEAIAMADKINY